MLKIKKLNFVLKSLRLYFYILFLVANKDTYIKIINIASTCINISRKLKDINAIIVFVNIINSLYIDRSSNSSRTRSLYLLKF